jgi:hypothetical protein
MCIVSRIVFGVSIHDHTIAVYAPSQIAPARQAEISSDVTALERAVAHLHHPEARRVVGFT